MYLRKNPWQRRLLTMSLMMVLGAVAGLIAWPAYRDHQLIRRLASTDADEYLPAIEQAAALARTDDRFARKLEQRLDTPSDRLFVNLLTVLGGAGQYPSDNIPAKYADRSRAIDVAGSPLAQVRWQAMWDLLTTGRDNEYVRAALAAAAEDEAPVVRELAAVLAAKLGADVVLAALLKDEEPQVVSATAIAAGAGGRDALAPHLWAALADREGRPPSLVWAIAKLDPNKDEAVSPAFASSQEPGDGEWCIYVLGRAQGATAASHAGDVLEFQRVRGEAPSAQALLAGAAHGLPEAGAAAKRVLAEAVGDGAAELTRGQLLAAVQAADATGVDCLAEAEAVCGKLWAPEPELAMIHAARLLGRQILSAKKRGRPEQAGAIAAAIKTLQRDALFEAPAPTTQPFAKPVTTPIASAAAAVALWECGAPQAEQFVRTAAAADATLAGDYIAWEMARLDADAAFEMGLRMLPPPFDPRRPAAEQPPRVFNQNERACGAMMLAWAARNTPKAAEAIERIQLRLHGGDFGRGATDWQQQNTLRCALLILGQEAQREAARRLLLFPQFPQRRSLGALIAARDRQAMDWLLWNTGLNDGDLLVLLIEKDVGGVLGEFFGSLPRVQPAATPDMRQWQTQMLRYSYIINRPKLGLRGDAP